MLFLVDEDSLYLADVLRRLGHSVRSSVEDLGGGATDADVCAHAEDLNAVVVTRNRHDFWRLLGPRPESRPRRFRTAGAMFVMVPSTLAEDRLKRMQQLWEIECELVKGTADPRLLVELEETRFLVHR